MFLEASLRRTGVEGKTKKDSYGKKWHFGVKLTGCSSLKLLGIPTSRNAIKKPCPPEFRLKLPKTGLGVGILFLMLSSAVHILSISRLNQVEKQKKIPVTVNHKRSQSIKIKMNTPRKIQSFQPNKKIVETPQQRTATKANPKKARLGKVNHSTLKETKVAKPISSKAQDPKKYAGNSKGNKKPATNTSAMHQPQQIRKTNSHLSQGKDAPSKPLKKKAFSSERKTKLKPRVTSNFGKLAIPKQHKARNKYEQLLNTSLTSMAGEVERGYQDYINEDLELGATVDLNTQEYRYIGYFTGLRKSIELTWTYPSTAIRRGLDGSVFVRFTIKQDGKVSQVNVLDSSGHKILDHAIVDAIKLAAPFAPLPESFGKKISIKGNFNYVLN